MTKVLTDEQIQQMIGEYRQGDSSLVLGARYGVTHKAILGLLERREIPRRPRKTRKLPLDESAFDHINEPSAYWAGFLMADGCVFHQAHHSPAIMVTLSAKDQGHLEQFRLFLKSEHAIRVHSRTDSYSTNPKVSYQVRSRRLVDALSLFGVTPDKSTNGPVQLLQNNRHFWRGFVDGDGCWYASGKTLRLSLCGTLSLLEQFRSFIHTLGVQGICAIKPGQGIHNLTCSGADACIVAHYFYQTCSIYLPRKKQVVDNWLLLC